MIFLFFVASVDVYGRPDQFRHFRDLVSSSTIYSPINIRNWQNRQQLCWQFNNNNNNDVMRINGNLMTTLPSLHNTNLIYVLLLSFIFVIGMSNWMNRQTIQPINEPISNFRSINIQQFIILRYCFFFFHFVHAVICWSGFQYQIVNKPVTQSHTPLVMTLLLFALHCIVVFFIVIIVMNKRNTSMLMIIINSLAHAVLTVCNQKWTLCQVFSLSIFIIYNNLQICFKADRLQFIDIDGITHYYCGP